MNDTDVRERPGRTHRPGGPPFDLVRSKLLHPLVRPGTISRSSLLDRLADGDRRRIVSVVAPPGYGKTTLLSQWAQRSGPAFAWVSVDEPDNDPKVLLTYVAEALDAVEPIGGRVFDALASAGSSVPGSVVPRLGSALASMTVPVVLVLDDVHLLRDQECRAALSVLADHVPEGARLVLAGRAEPPLRVARLRAEGRILEIGAAELSLTCAEAAVLLRGAGLELGSGEVAELYRRTEGWPAGLYLAALYLREGGSLGTAPDSFGGDDRLVSEYIESELLARISRRHRVFLTRTAVLGQMFGSLCEAVLEQPGSAATLAELARSNLLLVPLDRHVGWYRYHHLFRDMLLAELERVEPEQLPVLRRRAASWCLRNGLPEEALEYSIAAGDVDTVAGLVEKLAVPARRQGRIATLQRWFGWLDDRQGIGRHAMVTVLAALIYAWMGWPSEAERWADVIDGWQDRDTAQRHDSSVDGWAALLRAFMCRRGIEQMRANADEAAHRFAAQGILTAGPALLQGVAGILSGDLDEGDAFLENAVTVGEKTGAHEVLAAALAERSLLAMARGMEPGSRSSRTGRYSAAPSWDRGKLRDTSGLRRASPLGSAPGRYPDGAPAARQRSAAAVAADLRDTPCGPPGPDRAHPSPPRAGRPGRGQDPDAGDRRAAQTPTWTGHPGRRSRGATRSAVEGARPPHPRSIGPDSRRTAGPADARHAPVLPGDRRRDVSVTAHR
jgi:LuxR family transcriptional regulator, maltose regulon positive regulatory protein